jgi:hypothetical protein
MFGGHIVREPPCWYKLWSYECHNAGTEPFVMTDFKPVIIKANPDPEEFHEAEN